MISDNQYPSENQKKHFLSRTILVAVFALCLGTLGYIYYFNPTLLNPNENSPAKNPAAQNDIRADSLNGGGTGQIADNSQSLTSDISGAFSQQLENLQTDIQSLENKFNKINLTDKLSLSGGEITGKLEIADKLTLNDTAKTESLVPKSDDQYDLGSEDKSFNNAYIHKLWGSSILTIGNDDTSHSLSNNDDVLISGNLEVNGNSYFDGNINLNGNLISNLADPTSAQDAATKAYVDANGGGDSYFQRNGTILSPLTSGDSLDFTDSLLTFDTSQLFGGSSLTELGYLSTANSDIQLQLTGLDTGKQDAITGQGDVAGLETTDSPEFAGLTLTSGGIYVTGSSNFNDDVNFLGLGGVDITGDLGVAGDITAKGSDTQIQFNDNGVLNGDSAFAWDNNALSITGATTATYSNCSITPVANNPVLTGSGAGCSFLSQFKPYDKIVLTRNNREWSRIVKTVDSDTQITLLNAFVYFDGDTDTTIGKIPVVEIVKDSNGTIRKLYYTDGQEYIGEVDSEGAGGENSATGGKLDIISTNQQGLGIETNWTSIDNQITNNGFNMGNRINTNLDSASDRFIGYHLFTELYGTANTGGTVWGGRLNASFEGGGTLSEMLASYNMLEFWYGGDDGTIDKAGVIKAQLVTNLGGSNPDITMPQYRGIEISSSKNASASYSFAGTDWSQLYIDDWASFTPSGAGVTNQSGIWVNNIGNNLTPTNRYGIVLDGNGVGSDIVFGDSQQIKLSRNNSNGYLEVAGALKSTTGGFVLPDGTVLDDSGDLGSSTNTYKLASLNVASSVALVTDLLAAITWTSCCTTETDPISGYAFTYNNVLSSEVDTKNLVYKLNGTGNNEYLTAPDNDAFSFGNGTTDSAFTAGAWVEIIRL